VGGKLANIFQKLYLDSAIPGAVVSLYANRVIQNIAAGAIGLFLPIFLLQQYQSIYLVLLFYLVSFGLYLFSAASGARLASYLTFRRALILSVFGGTAFFISLFLFETNLILFSILGLAALNIDRMFYWVPYHSAFAKFTDQKNRGRVLALLDSAISLFSIFLPVAAGLIIAHYGFNILFLIVIFVYLSSVIPLWLLPPINEYYTFGYLQTWKILFHRRDRKILFTYLADGVQDFIGLAIWPIFIWQVLAGDFQAVGLVSSLIVLATILLRLLMGNYADKFDKKRLLRYGTILFSLGWFFKAFIQTSFQIFFFSTYHNFAAIAMRTPFDALMYEKAADAGHYLDEYTVLREMALNLGRILAIVILFFLLNLTSVKFSFIIAAVAALFINLI